MGRSGLRERMREATGHPLSDSYGEEKFSYNCSSVFLEDDLSRTDFGPASGCVSILVYKYRDVTKSLLEKIFVLAQIAL